MEPARQSIESGSGVYDGSMANMVQPEATGPMTSPTGTTTSSISMSTSSTPPTSVAPVPSSVPVDDNKTAQAAQNGHAAADMVDLLGMLGTALESSAGIQPGPALESDPTPQFGPASMTPSASVAAGVKRQPSSSPEDLVQPKRIKVESPTPSTMPPMLPVAATTTAGTTTTTPPPASLVPVAPAPVFDLDVGLFMDDITALQEVFSKVEPVQATSSTPAAETVVAETHPAPGPQVPHPVRESVEVDQKISPEDLVPTNPLEKSHEVLVLSVHNLADTLLDIVVRPSDSPRATIPADWKEAFDLMSAGLKLNRPLLPGTGDYISMPKAPVGTIEINMGIFCSLAFGPNPPVQRLHAGIFEGLVREDAPLPALLGRVYVELATQVYIQRPPTTDPIKELNRLFHDGLFHCLLLRRRQTLSPSDKDLRALAETRSRDISNMASIDQLKQAYPYSTFLEALRELVVHYPTAAEEDGLTALEEELARISDSMSVTPSQAPPQPDEALFHSELQAAIGGSTASPGTHQGPSNGVGANGPPTALPPEEDILQVLSALADNLPAVPAPVTPTPAIPHHRQPSQFTQNAVPPSNDLYGQPQLSLQRTPTAPQPISAAPPQPRLPQVPGSGPGRSATTPVPVPRNPPAQRQSISRDESLAYIPRIPGAEKIKLPSGQDRPTYEIYALMKQKVAYEKNGHARRVVMRDINDPDGDAHHGDSQTGHVQSSNNRRSWTLEEETSLLVGLDIIGGPSWSSILQLYGKEGTLATTLATRNQVQLKDKARNLKLFFLKNDLELPVSFEGVTGDLKTRGPGSKTEGGEDRRRPKATRTAKNRITSPPNIHTSVPTAAQGANGFSGLAMSAASSSSANGHPSLPALANIGQASPLVGTQLQPSAVHAPSLAASLPTPSLSLPAPASLPIASAQPMATTTPATAPIHTVSLEERVLMLQNIL